MAAASVLNTAVQTGIGYAQQVEATRDVFSAEIWFAALPIMKFDQFSTKRTELGVQPGRTIQMPRYGNIARGGRLTEGVPLQTRAMNMSLQSISVYEQGNAIGFSEFLLQTSFYDQLSAASLLLGRDMALVLDGQLRDTAIMGTNVIFGGQKASRSLLATNDVFNTTIIKDAVEVLETNNSPKWAGDHYICFLHPHQGRGLKDDNDWINASLYSGATQIYTGEIGRYEDVRFIATTVMPNGVNGAIDPFTGDYVDPGFSAALAKDSVSVGNPAVNVFQAVFFGEYAFGHATALPVELRDNGVEDYGREHGLAYYGIWGSNVLENPNIVVAETA
jgi:N4-gp56 family major capsid protein